MHNNILFSKNIELSRSEREIIFFDYRSIVIEENIVAKNKKAYANNPHSKYPIYMTVSKSKICFFLHHLHHKDSNEYWSYHHMNSAILTLSVDTGAEVLDNLTKHIQESYYETIHEKSQDQIEFKNNNSNKLISYSTLNIFKQNNTLSSQSDRQTIILRHLFLDFLYTAEHTQIFHSAPSFNHVYAELTKNFLFRAIRNKAEYYYQREIINEHIKNEKDHSLFLFELNLFLQAERLWIETITDPSSEKAFHLAKQWLGNNKSELDKVFTSSNTTQRSSDIYFNNHTAIENNHINQYYDMIRDNSSLALSWYQKKYQFSAFFRILYGFRGKHIGWIYYLLLAIFAFNIIILGYIINDYISYTISIYLAIILVLYPLVVWAIKTKGLIPMLKQLLHSFYQRCLRVKSYTNKNSKVDKASPPNYLKARNPYSIVNVYLPRLFAAISTAWCSLSIDDAIYTNFFDKEIGRSLWMVIGSLSITLLFLYNEASKANKYKKFSFKVFRATQLGLIAFFYSVITGIFAMNFFAGYYLQNSDSVNNFYQSHIFIHSPDYEISYDKTPEFVTRNLYHAISKYNPSILENINNIDFDESGWNSRLKTTYKGEKHLTLNYGKSLAVLHSLFSTPNNVDDKKDTNQTESIQSATAQTKSDQAERPVEEDTEEETQKLYTINKYDKNSLSYRLQNLEYNEYSRIMFQEGFIKDFEISEKNKTDTSWIFLLRLLNDPVVYQQALCELTPTKESGYSNKIITKIGGLEIMNNMLIQFSIFAMFIGVFLQSIFSEKSVSDPG